MKTIFYITPVGKPRMVRSDTWAGRPAVSRYWAFKDELNSQAKALKYTLPDTFRVTFYIPQPNSWSIKKRSSHEEKPHKQTPDGDNLLKGLQDALRTDDSSIYDVRITKLWSIQPRIEIEEL